MSSWVKVGIFTAAVAVIVVLAALIVQDRLHPTIDKNNDGKPDEWYEYNLKGELVWLKKDRNFDGKIDLIEYYKNGNISVLMEDMNRYGVFDAIIRYDDQGRMITLERDLDKDGKMDRIIHFDPETQRQIGAENITH